MLLTLYFNSYPDLKYIDFVTDRMRKDAVARDMEVIGEAINKLPKAFLEEHIEVEWHKAIRVEKPC
jgi:uncharacterized protein with HEPN domain